MDRVTFVLKFDQVGVPGSAATLWLDTSRDDVIQPGEEVTMATIDGKVWLADRELSATAGMQFLVKFIAPIGAAWSFAAKTSDRTLYEVANQQMTTVKESLAGRLS